MIFTDKRYKIYLCSNSPRRRELLTQLQVPFEVMTSKDVDEVYPSTLSAERIPEYLANLKADAYLVDIDSDTLLITADTVVISDGAILGKPNDSDDAKSMLRNLSGKTHKVITGVAIVTKEKRVSFSVATDVTFADITDEEIAYYVDNFRPMDKAGAYGIQEWIGCVAVESISGSFYNVMGLPVQRLYRELKQF
jgi:septum formation protein